MSRLSLAFASGVLLFATVGCGTTPAPVDQAVLAGADVAVLDGPPHDWAALDGRRVRIAAKLAISGNHRLGREREVVASFGTRLYAPTEVALPGAGAGRVADDNARRSLVLALPEAAARAPGDWRSGGTLDGVEGAVAVDGSGRARLTVEAAPGLQPAPRPAAPRVAGELRLASLNLQNLFNGDGRGGGFPTPRGARTQDGYAHQLARLVATIEALDADIVALMELENDGYGPDSSLAQLVAALDPAGMRWRFVDAGSGPGRDPIRVGLIYRADRVATAGRPAALEGGPFGELSRAPLAQAFRAGNGPAFTVVANHFKSKGCRDASGADRDQGDGQACWNATRRASGERLRQWLATDPGGTGGELVAIVGDLNAYGMEDPIRDFLDAGWHDALATAGDVSVRPYSYVYDAQAGRLDHVLLSPALGARLQGAAAWHANADEAPNVGDMHGNGAQGAAQPWRSSDHDPAIVGLRLRTP